MIENIQFKNISFSRNKSIILDKIDLQLNSTNYILMTGQNGSGKSTLLRILSGLLKADTLSLDVGKSINTQSDKIFLRKNFCYLHQTPYLFSSTVYNNIAYGLKYQGLSKTEIAMRVNNTLKLVGLEHLSQRKSHELSGGEKQRVAIARSWIIKPKFILLDEPFANMDKHSRLDTYAILNRLKQENMGIIITSHDPHHGELDFNQHWHLFEGKMTIGLTGS